MYNIYREKLKELSQKKKLLVTEQKRIVSSNVVTYKTYSCIKKRIENLTHQMEYCRSKLLPDIIA